MNITVNLTIHQPIADVWEVMGNQFGHAHIWSSNFKSSKPVGEARFAGLDYSSRDTVTDRGRTVQELTEFDAAKHSFTYQITEGAPPIAQFAGATWSLSEEGASDTQLTMDFVMEPKSPLPPEMEAKVQAGLTASVTQLAQELKYFLEEGQPHPNTLQ